MSYRSVSFQKGDNLDFFHTNSSKERARWDLNERTEQTGNWMSEEQRAK